MNFTLTTPVKLFDQTERYGPIKNIFGIGDPHVVKIENQWWMFFGGFQSNFKNNIFSAYLPAGKGLDCNDWKIMTYENHPKKAKPLIANSTKGSWDYYGYHTPCFVSGFSERGDAVERVYYTGRASKKVLDNEAPYSIGVIEKRDDQWVRYQEPIITGTTASPNVLEPKVRYFDGLWRMWYVTTVQETGKTGEPRYTIQYIESQNGINDWSEPISLFNEDENFYDASVHQTPSSGFEMTVCRSTNLYGRTPFPQQGLWLLEGKKPNGDRNNWSTDPYQLIDCDSGAEWYKHGTAAPCGYYGENEEDRNTLYLFFTGVNEHRNWLDITVSRLKKGKKPPFPSPFYFSIGKVECHKIV